MGPQDVRRRRNQGTMAVTQIPDIFALVSYLIINPTPTLMAFTRATNPHGPSAPIFYMLQVFCFFVFFGFVAAYQNLLLLFFKKMGQTRPLFVFFHSFHNTMTNIAQI